MCKFLHEKQQKVTKAIVLSQGINKSNSAYLEENLNLRHEYCLHLRHENQQSQTVSKPTFEIRSVQPPNIKELAELMIESYKGTIDSDGETLEDAANEVQNYLDGKCGGQALLNESCLAFTNQLLIGACLVVEWKEKQQPLVAYVMTRAELKKQGVGQQILLATLQALTSKGYSDVYAVITEGNTPSERLFLGMGFQKNEFG